MTERLRETADSGDEAVTLAAEIVRRAALPASEAPPTVKARVRRALDQGSRPVTGTARARRRLRGPLLVLGGLLGSATVAFALEATAYWCWVRSAQPVTAPAAAAPRRGRREGMTNGASAQPVPAQTVTVQLPAMTIELDRDRKEPPTAALAPAPDPRESVLILSAMKALRQDKDAAHAVELLDSYIASYPRGALAEEALALEIEAESTLGDPRAATLADQYVVRYPEGRFLAAARAAKERLEK